MSCDLNTVIDAYITRYCGSQTPDSINCIIRAKYGNDFRATFENEDDFNMFITIMENSMKLQIFYQRWVGYREDKFSKENPYAVLIKMMNNVNATDGAAKAVKQINNNKEDTMQNQNQTEEVVLDTKVNGAGIHTVVTKMSKVKVAVIAVVAVAAIGTASYFGYTKYLVKQSA